MLSDEALAVRAGRGDDPAFEELVRRYEPLLRRQARRVPEGQDADDARQEALIGLFEACRATDGQRRFAGMAEVNVRWRISRARRDAATIKHRLLSDAARDGVLPEYRLAAPQSTDPATLVELREQLRSCLREHPGALDQALSANDHGRRFSPAQVATALALVADGATITHAAANVGATYNTVRDWIERQPAEAPARRALQARLARCPDGNLSRRFSREQKQRALRMVADGSSLRAAATAVGASTPTILRWLRQAA